MKLFLTSLISIITLSISSTVMAANAKTYSNKICNEPGLKCYKVKINDTWDSLFPNPRHRELVQKLNRANVSLRSKMIIAVPENLNKVNLMSVSPFKQKINTNGRETLLIKQSKLAWGAYNNKGQLIKWGPIAGGRSYCPDVGRSCRTVNGNFSVFKKKGAECVSNTYPLGKGGAPMPYCMFFAGGGYAIHGWDTLPGYNDSHGCVHTLHQDAKWLYQEFIKMGTSVIVTN